MIGISAGDGWSSWDKAWLPLLFSLLAAIVFFVLHAWKHAYAQRHFFGLAVFFIFFFFGQFSVLLSLRFTDYSWSKNEEAYSAVLLDVPEEKERSMLCRVLVTHVRDSSGIRPVNRKILLYLSKDSASRAIGLKDALLFYARVVPPANNGNPNEFLEFNL